MRILWSHVLYNLLPGHDPKTLCKGRLGYEAIGTTLDVYHKYTNTLGMKNGTPQKNNKISKK